MPRKQKSNNPHGRPSSGVDEVRVLVPMPEALARCAAKLAAEAGVSRAEWIREAMRAQINNFDPFGPAAE